MIVEPLQTDQPLAGIFRENVQRIIDERGRGSQTQLAARLGCSPAHVSQFLTADYDVKLKTVQEWAKALDVDWLDLLKMPQIDA